MCVYPSSHDSTFSLINQMFARSELQRLTWPQLLSLSKLSALSLFRNRRHWKWHSLGSWMCRCLCDLWPGFPVRTVLASLDPVCSVWVTAAAVGPQHSASADNVDANTRLIIPGRLHIHIRDTVVHTYEWRPATVFKLQKSMFRLELNYIDNHVTWEKIWHDHIQTNPLCSVIDNVVIM